MARNPGDSTRFRFTESKVRDLPAPIGARQVRCYDTALPGFCLRVTASGMKVFGVYRKVHGRPMDLTLGRWPGLTVEKARKLAQETMGDIAAGIDPQADKRELREEATLGDLFKDFLELHAKPRKRSWKEDEGLWNRYLVSWRNRRLSAITPADVQAWHGRVGRDHGQGGANRGHSFLRKMFNFARMRGWKGGNPAQGVQRFRERTRERFLDAAELRQFLSALAAEPDRTSRDFFLLALLTGARRSNVLGMRWADLDLDRGLWRIPGEKAKAGDDLVVILAPQVVVLLRERREMVGASPWVLPSPSTRTKTGHFVEPKCAWDRIRGRAELSRLVAMIGEKQRWTPAATEQAQQDAEGEVDRIRGAAFGRRMPKGTDPWAVVLEKYRAQVRALHLDPEHARMRDIRIHDLRRTMGSWQAAAGASLSIIGRSLGHKQVQTTAIYARISLDPVRESVEKATSAMLAVGGPFQIADPGTKPT
ncbi:MAG: integrase family protein [Planctomycetes bacterium]|nr:integrase family protein [Planctomycetota bacterium]